MLDCTDIRCLGKFLDRNMKKLSSKHGTYRRGGDISDFPIEKARFTGIYALIAVSALGTAAYGVSLLKRSVSPPPQEPGLPLSGHPSTSPSPW